MGGRRIGEQKSREIVGSISVPGQLGLKIGKSFASDQQKSIYQLGAVERTLKKNKCSEAEGL